MTADRRTVGVGEATRQIERSSDGALRIEGFSDPVYVTKIDAATCQITLADRQILVYVAVRNDRGWAFVDGQAFEIDLFAGRAQAQAAHESGNPLAAPMPATVLTVLVEPGQSVAAGDPVILLEAMKMELTLRAPQAGVIETVACSQGDLVQPGVPLVTLKGEGI